LSSITHQPNLLLANQINFQTTEKHDQLNQEISENPISNQFQEELNYKQESS
jgi:hypothetical protein